LRELGLLVPALELSPHDYPVRGEKGEGGLLLAHPKIPFVSFAHEWSPRMLFAAGALTLELQARALAAGYTLKDAAPANILFDGGRGIFVDYLSFEPLAAERVLWMAQAQFERNFILPLLIDRLVGKPPHAAFLASTDGLQPEEVYRHLSVFQRLTPLALRYASLPAWLRRPGQRDGAGSVRPESDPQKADFIRGALLRGLRKNFQRLTPAGNRRSVWSHYMSEHSYDSEAFAAKEAFVTEALETLRPGTVLDVGCNTGHFSRLAARAGARVVAIDCDATSIDEVWRLNESAHLPILPLVMNLARPSPALGWANAEQASFLERAQGHFDAALLLAVIHHLSTTEGVPLPEIFRVVATLVKKGAVVEYVSTEDAMMRRLLRNKEHLLPLLTQAQFEAALAPWFTIVRRLERADRHRCLYLLDRRASSQ
jgi:2-polyprenyl-3-methyl-5-hydroxy-6-metoxy-1,4-benzoquinol methylase